MSTNLERDLFQPYLTHQFGSAGAVTYGEKLKVIAQLRQDVFDGKVPIQPDQVIRLKRENPAVQAVREGRAVSLDGVDSTETSSNTRWQGIIGLVILLSLPLCGFGGWWLMQRGETASTNVAAVLTREPAKPTDEPTETLTPEPTATQPPTPTPFPTVTPIEQPRQTQIEFARRENPEPMADNAPVALEVAGDVFAVQTALLQDRWQPQNDAIEWWPETHIQRLFAMPYDEGLLQKLFSGAYPYATVRLRSGEQIAYEVNDLQQVNRLQTEVLSAREPGITIVLYTQDTNPNRWVIRGRAVQTAATQFTSFSGMPQSTNNDLNITWIEGASHTVDEYRIEVRDCVFSSRSEIGRTVENDMTQQILCWVAINSAETTADLQIADANWLAALEWLSPTQIVAQTTITETNTTVVQLAGVVRSSETARPLLLWSHDQKRYGFQLNAVPIQAEREP